MDSPISAPDSGPLIEIEVAYAAAARQTVVRLAVPPGCSLRQAVERSGLLPQYPEIDLETSRLGVFGRLRQPEEAVQAGDRVEIYRPLIDQICTGSIKSLIAEATPAFGGGGGDDEDGAPAPRRGARKTVMLAGWLSDIRNVGGERPGKIIILDDRTGQIVCWLGFDEWQRFQNTLRKDTLVFASGEIRAVEREGREREYRLYPRGFWDLDAAMRERAERVTLTWRRPASEPAALRSRLGAWRSEHGASVTLEYWNGRARATLDFGPQWRLKVEEASLTELRRLLGDEAVRVDYRRFVAPQPSRTDYSYGE